MSYRTRVQIRRTCVGVGSDRSGGTVTRGRTVRSLHKVTTAPSR